MGRGGGWGGGWACLVWSLIWCEKRVGGGVGLRGGKRVECRTLKVKLSHQLLPCCDVDSMVIKLQISMRFKTDGQTNLRFIKLYKFCDIFLPISWIIVHLAYTSVMKIFHVFNTLWWCDNTKTVTADGLLAHYDLCIGTFLTFFFI